MAGNWQFHWLQHTIMLSFLYLSFTPGWVHDGTSADGARKSELSDHPRLTGSYGSNLWYLRLQADLGHGWTVLEVTGQTPGHVTAQPDLHLTKKNIESWNVPGLYITFCFICGERRVKCRFRAFFPMSLVFRRRTALNMPSVICNLYAFYSMLCPHFLTSTLLPFSWPPHP